MSDFEPAFQVVLKHEGGYVNDPVDPGGITNFGITLRSAQEHWGSENVTPAFMRTMRVQDARDFYYARWQRLGLSELQSQAAATKVFDAQVNMGSNGVKCAQRACGVDDDGRLGPMSIAAINALPTFVERYTEELENYYKALAAKKPQLQKFLKGWLSRAKWGA